VLDELIQRASTDNLDFKMGSTGCVRRAPRSRTRVGPVSRIASHAAYSRRTSDAGSAPQRATVESAELGSRRWRIDLFGRVRHGVNAARADAREATPMSRSRA